MAPLLDRIDAKLAGVRPLVLAGIVIVSTLLRLVYVLQAQGGPLPVLHRSPMSDMHFNHVWAERIAAGDVLVDEPLHPVHAWHEGLAAQHFARHPGADELKRGGAERPGEVTEPARLLWNRWYGGNTLHQEPLYAYLLALMLRVFGTDVWPMLWLQLGLGVIGNVLIYAIARRYFGDLAGTLAGVLATLCAPVLYYELILLRDSTVAVLGLLLVFLTQRAIDRPTLARWASVGAGFGVGLTLKSSLALLLAVVILAVPWMYRREGRALLLRAGVMLAAVVLCLLPAVSRNLAVGAPALALSSVGAITFIGANTEDYGRAGGLLGDFFVSPQHAADIMSRTDGRLLPSIRATLATHDGPGSYLRQLVAKLGAILWWYEIPNNTNFYYFGLHAPLLRLLPVTFGILGPLAGIGLVIAASGIRRCWPLYALVTTTVLVMLAFGVFSRLRIPLVVALIPFAALTLTRLADWAAARRLVPLLCTAGGVLLLAWWSARPLPDGQPLIRPSDYSAAYIAWYGPEIDAAYRRGDPCGAADVYTASLLHEPEEIRRLAGQHGIRYPHEGQLAAIFRKVHDRQASALEACLGQTTEPATQARLAQEIGEQRRRVAGIDAAVAGVGRTP